MHVQITTDGDKQIDLEAEEEVKEGEEKKEVSVLMPPQICGTPHQVAVNVIKGEGFPKLETFSKQIDAMVEAHFGNKMIKTEVKKTDGDAISCYWREEMFLPTALPNMTDKLVIKVFDYDSAGSNDLVGL